jgi:small conductance mechanosensitive channel
LVAKKSIQREIGWIILIIALGIATTIFARFMSDENRIPEAFLLPIYAIIILVTAYAWTRIVTIILEKVVEPKLGPTTTHGIKNLFYIVVAIVVAVIVSAVFGLNIGGILVGAGFAGIVLGLAAQQVIGNIFAGLSLLASRPFDIGDRITLVTSSYGLMGGSYSHEATLNGFTGTVIDVGIFYTKITLDEGTPAVFPNSVVLGSMAVDHASISLRTVRVRMDLDKSLDYNLFKSKFLESMEKYKQIDSGKTKVEIVDIGSTTYQVVMIVWAKSAYEEPIKTIIIGEALKIQSELTTNLQKKSHP